MNNWFSGSCVTDIDPRGSFPLPRFVETALAKAQNRFAPVIESHPHLPCLVLKLGGSSVGSSYLIPRRMTLPPQLRAHAAIGPRMLAVSACRHVELWDPMLGSIFGDADVKLLGRFEHYMEADACGEHHGARYRFRPPSSGPEHGEDSLWRQWTFN